MRVIALCGCVRWICLGVVVIDLRRGARILCFSDVVNEVAPLRRGHPKVGDLTDVTLPAIVRAYDCRLVGLARSTGSHYIWVVVVRNVTVRVAAAIIELRIGTILRLGRISAEDRRAIDTPTDENWVRPRVVGFRVETCLAEWIAMVMVIEATPNVRHATICLACVLNRQSAIVFVWVDGHTVDHDARCTRHWQVFGWQSAFNRVRHAVCEKRVVERDLERLALHREGPCHALVSIASAATAWRMRNTLQVRFVIWTPLGVDNQEVVVAEGGLHSRWLNQSGLQSLGRAYGMLS